MSLLVSNLANVLLKNMKQLTDKLKSEKKTNLKAQVKKLSLRWNNELLWNKTIQTNQHVSKQITRRDFIVSLKFLFYLFH